jgi:hypothetical protein
LYQWRSESLRLTRLLKSDEHSPGGLPSFRALVAERAAIREELDRLSAVCDDCTVRIAVDREELDTLHDQWGPVQDTLLRDAADLSLAVHATIAASEHGTGQSPAGEAIDALRREEVGGGRFFFFLFFFFSFF